MEELKPCPICGASMRYIYSGRIIQHDTDRLCPLEGLQFTANKDLMRLWNARVMEANNGRP